MISLTKPASTQSDLPAALARQVLNDMDAGLISAGDLRETLSEYAADLIPEDQQRFAEQLAVFDPFMEACRQFDMAIAEGDAIQVAQHAGEIRRLVARSRQAMRFKGLTAPAEALATAKDLDQFREVLPSVPLDRLYGSGFGQTSPFPLIWALGARSNPVQRVQLMLEAGARLDLRTRLKETVLHAMARMNRKARTRPVILDLLLSAGGDVNARCLKGMTPLAVALAEGSKEDIANFIAVGAEIGEVELQAAAETPDRLQLVLDRMANAGPELDLVGKFSDWLEEEVVRASGHHADAVAQGTGSLGLADRVEQLRASLSLTRKAL